MTLDGPTMAKMGPIEPNIAEIELGTEATAGIKLRDGHPEAQNKGRVVWT